MKTFSLLVFLVTFVIGTDTFLVAPLLPTLQAHYGVQAEAMGWLISAYALGYAVFALIAGPISDRLNRRTVMLFGLAAFAVCTFACGLADSFWLMLLLRTLAGVAASFVTPQIWASIPVLVPVDSTIKVFGFATAGLSIAQVLGVPLGSVLAEADWRTPFFALGVLAVLVGALVLFRFPSVSPIAGNSWKEPGPGLWSIYRQILRQPRAGWVIFAYFLFQTGTYTTFSFIGSWYQRDFGLDVAQLGLMIIGLGIGNALGSLSSGKLAVRLGRARTMLLLICVLIGLAAILPFAGNLLIAELVLVLFFLGCGLLFPLVMALFQSLSSSSRGTVAALANSAMYAGATIGAALGGLLLARFPGFYGVAFFTAAAYALALAGYFRAGAFQHAPGQAVSTR